MTNIYNKKVLVENGTLINNWYEEEVLKKVTGQTRTIPGVHVKKKKIDGELDISDQSGLIKDNTKIRTLGVNTIHPYDTTNSYYGDFSSKEHQFNKVGVKDKIFKDFFTSYLTNEKNEKHLHEQIVKNTRLNESSYKSSMIKQPEIQKIGSRHMVSQNNIPIDQGTLDKLFMASHDMSKFKKIIPEDKAKEYFDQVIPYYNDKEITFWSQNMEKSNMYKSHSKGKNAFAKSSGFTQTVNDTKAVNQYNGNVESSKEAKFIYTNPEDEIFTQSFIDNNQKRVEDLTESIRNKFLAVVFKKGWLGVRKYKQFLFNLSKRRSTFIEKSDFKYYTTNFGIYFSDKEVDFIYNLLDLNKSSKICYEKFIETMIKTDCKEKQDLVEKFYEYALNLTRNKKENSKVLYNKTTKFNQITDAVSLKILDENFNENKHPEALSYSKVSAEIKKEFIQFWDCNREDDIISKNGFLMFFDDVATSVADFESFKEILRSFGFQC